MEWLVLVAFPYLFALLALVSFLFWWYCYHCEVEYWKRQYLSYRDDYDRLLAENYYLKRPRSTKDDWEDDVYKR